MVHLIHLVFFFTISPSALPQEVVPTVVIDGDQSSPSPIDPFSVFKSENVSKEKFKEPQRQNLTDLVKDQAGVDAQVYCANCGAKRLTINGLKGEHTSILVDGLPLHSAVSSFYGVDNVPINGIQDVQVMRGAGASLTNPEAIGGTLNIITVDPLSAANNYQTSFGVDDQFNGKSQNHSLLYNLRDDSKNWGISFGGQWAENKTWDQDHNTVAEMPQRQNFSGLIKSRLLIGTKNEISMRMSLSELDILGGPAHPKKPTQIHPTAATSSDFESGSVEESYLGDPLQITDWVHLDRTESAITGTHYISDKHTLDWKLGYARQEQKAIYQHGFDYANIDNMLVGDTKLQWSPSDSHVFTAGVFFKDQRLRSASATLFTPYGFLPKDSFDFSSIATYGQYSWFFKDKIEMNLALRADQVRVNWLELSNEVQETILAPRFQIKHNFTDHLSQRFSYGLGYRAPLTFFESQHGNQENGYQVDITELEKAHSFVYSLSLNQETYYLTASTHYTHLENMAYGYEQSGQAILYRNSDDDYDIWVNDFLAGVKPWSWWLLEGSVEFFQYQKGYKEKLPTAAIEKRYQFKSTMDRGPWSHTLRANIVGSRDISQYGSYDEHYRKQTPVVGPNADKKNSKSPTWLTLDTQFTYRFNPALVLSLSVENIFNETQAARGDSPSTWHSHDGHFHFDGLHTWGPNRGRQYILGLSGQF